VLSGRGLCDGVASVVCCLVDVSATVLLVLCVLSGRCLCDGVVSVVCVVW